MSKQISNEIFTGPAGTGKTLAAKKRAVAIIDGSAPASLEGISQRFRELVVAKRVFAPTLHPNYSYADWVEGYRPTTTDGKLQWEITNGIFLDAVEACGENDFSDHFKPGQVIQSSTRSRYNVVHVDRHFIELERHDKRSNLISSMDQVSFHDVRTCIEKDVRPSDLSHSGANKKNLDARKKVAGKLGWSTTRLTNTGGLRAVLETVITEQTRSPRRDIVLFVDEINRADPGRLWGELLTILEPNKRSGQPEEQPVQLQFSRNLLTIPSSLHIIGTMNSADRSISTFDVAYRRRFDFIWTGPDATMLDAYAGVDLQSVLTNINNHIHRDLGRDWQVGHAELMQHKLEARRAEHAWGGPDRHARALTDALRTWLVPLLRDIFGNDLVRVKRVLGKLGGFITELPSVDGDSPEDYWVDDTEALDDSADWWDPRGAAWDFNRVQGILSSTINRPSAKEAPVHPADSRRPDIEGVQGNIGVELDSLPATNSSVDH